MKRLTGIFFILMLVTSCRLFAQGDLLITPKRIVFEGNKQREEINLVNIGTDTATYSISFMQYTMKEDGSFVFIETPAAGQMFADTFLRIFPRKVTLAPREPQVISLQCRRGPSMVPGEYRSHLYFRSEKNTTPTGLENNTADSTKLKIQLIPVFGLSIPVIIRMGDVNVNAGLQNFKLETLPDQTQIMHLSIMRTGNMSIYGDIIIQHFPADGKPVDIGRVTNVGVYTTTDKRNIMVKLKNGTNKLTPGKLKIQYLTKTEKNTIIHAEGEMEIM
ncbi:MAG: hypothetical protein H7X88_02070 [Gloeobacteraceae cyanobacterium ES-bin-316]|nr:hypothetical protein [Ferruginibacter sp.]